MAYVQYIEGFIVRDGEAHKRLDDLEMTSGDANERLTNLESANAEANERLVNLETASAGLLEKPNYGKLIVFGDSISRGYGNGNRGYVEILGESGYFEKVTNAAVSGSTFATLPSKIEEYIAEVTEANHIFIQFQTNDISNCFVGNLEMGTFNSASSEASICGYIRKSLERIYELNPSVKITYLPNVVYNRAWYEAFSDNVARRDIYILFEATALRVIESYGCHVLNLYEGFTNSYYKQSDGAHLTEEAYKVVANHILHNLFTEHESVPIHRRINLSGSTANGWTIDIEASTLMKLLNAGVDVDVLYDTGYFAMIMRPTGYNSGFFIFSSTAVNPSNAATVIEYVLVWQVSTNTFTMNQMVLS